LKLVLNEICDFVNGGAWSDDEYVDSGIHVVKVTNMEDGGIIEKNDDYLPLSKYEKYRQHELRTDDVVVATVGSHPTQPGSVVGRTARIPNAYSGSFLNQNAVCLRTKNSHLVDQRYLFYLSKTVLFKHHIESRARGSANQVRMAIGELKKFTADYPSIDTQRKIAAILLAYDELIENNKRRIALLEKLAEEIYREWFIRFRFPGHKKLKLLNHPLRDFINEYFGGDWGEDTRSPKFSNRVYVIRGTDFDSIRQGDIASVPIRYIKDSGLRNRNLTVGDLIVENSVNHQSRTAGKSLLVTQHVLDLFSGDVICASFCKLIRPKDPKHSKFLSLNFRLLFKQGLFDYFQNIATNGIANLQAERFMDRHRISFHDDIDLSVFDSLDTTFLANSLAKLKQTRDLLLLRLMSGKLAVENLNIQFPPGMAKELDAQPIAAHV